MLAGDALHCSWLLELPEKQLEQQFWRDERVLKYVRRVRRQQASSKVLSALADCQRLPLGVRGEAALSTTWANLLLNAERCT